MSAINISDSAAQLIPENKLRKALTIQNEDASINVFVKQEAPGSTTVSATDHDHRLGPGGIVSVTITEDGEQAVRGRWTIIAASGTPLISFFESEIVDRTTGKTL